MAIIWNKTIIRRLLCIILFIFLVLVIIRYNSNKPVNVHEKNFKKASLTYKKQKFYLNDEPFNIYSGSIHYFRVPLEMWKSRLQYLKSAGLNTVMTYLPWNLHEEKKGIYNFEGYLNIRKFVQTAHELGLKVILRPGPYICAEFEFGGMPGWLLSDPNMKVRSMYLGFLKPAEEYIKQLMKEVNDLQHSNGGPIIAFQIENEYGTYGSSKSYMLSLKTIFQRAGVVESMFISNNAEGFNNQHKIDDVFLGINSNSLESIEKMATSVKSFDFDNPIFISEFWVGWFHMWGYPGTDSIISKSAFKSIIKTMLKQGYNFNLYMFHGGTNFGFLNGASKFKDKLTYGITSYDYGAPLSEDGRPTTKYFILRRALLRHLSNDKNFKIDEVPEKSNPADYGEVEMTHSMDLVSLLELVDNYQLKSHPITMEDLKINGNSGQNFGFIVYQADLHQLKTLFIEAKIRDRAIILVNGVPISGDWRSSLVNYNNDPVSFNYTVSPIPLPHTTYRSKSRKLLGLSSSYLSNKRQMYRLEILVENQGRANYATFQSELFGDQRKGLSGKVFADNQLISDWKIYPLEFQKAFMNRISSSLLWKKTVDVNLNHPRMYKGTFTLTETPANTFVSVSTWTKGVVFVNGFNLGRYWNIGPTQTLFLPKSFLRYGENEIMIFELHSSNQNIRLLSNPVFLSKQSSNFS